MTMLDNTIAGSTTGIEEEHMEDKDVDDVMTDEDFFAFLLEAADNAYDFEISDELSDFIADFSYDEYRFAFDMIDKGASEKEVIEYFS